MPSFGSLFLMALLPVAGFATAEAIPPEARTYLLQHEADKTAAGKPQRYEFHVEGKIDFEQTSFAALLKGAVPEKAPEIFLNEKRVELSPVAGREGLVVLLPWKDLQLGDNVLVLQPSSLEALDVTAVEVFSLVGSGEESHFERIFGENISWEKAAPGKQASQYNFEPVHYDLGITTNLADTFISGTMKFTGRSKINGLTQVALDFANNSGVMAAATASVQQVLPGNVTVSIAATHASDRVVMTLNQALNVDDEFTVIIPYSGYPKTGGSFGSAYRRETHNGTPIIYTFNEPYKARNWFPCIDLPEYKATFEMKVTAPESYSVVSNGKLLSVTDNGSTNTFHWSESHPISTYLVSMTCTNYAYVEADYTALDGMATMPVGIYYFPEQAAEATGLNATVDILGFFADKFGEYAFLDEKYVNASHLSGSGMEHNTNTSMPFTDVQKTSGINSDPTPGRHRRNVHEVAHHWFGNQVTCKTFDHVWLNEGWATLAEALYYEELYGRQAYLNYVAGWDSTGISDTTPMVSSGADSFLGSVVYRKGGYVLHMLRGVVGDADFYEAARLYLQTHAHGIVATEDLQAAYETVSGLDLSAFFDQWCYKRSRPSYNYGWAPTFVGGDNGISLTIDQTQSGSNVPNIFVMPIPIVVSDIGGNSATFIVQNNLRNQNFVINTGPLVPFTVEFDPEGWVLKNVNSGTKASAPRIRSAIGSLSGSEASVTVDWTHGTGGATPTGYQIMLVEEGGMIIEAAAVSGSITTHTINGLDPDSTYHVFVRAIAVPGQPSDSSNVYAFHVATGGEKLLIVEGYERWFSQSGRAPFHPFAAWHGDAIGAHGYGFDNVCNTRVINGAVKLGDYDALVWVLGEESTADSSFDTTEQGLVSAYMEAGGKLFVNGAEIGWDLHRTVSSQSDKDFYQAHLKSTFVNTNDGSGIWSGLYGTTGSIFGGISGLSINNNDGKSYFAQWPDVLTPISGAVPALQYNASKVAGLQYEGTFGSGTEEGKLVYLGFGFETIEGASNREMMMGQVLNFFFPPMSIPDAFILH